MEYQNRPASCPSRLTFGHSKLKCPKANYQWIPKLPQPSSLSVANKSVERDASLLDAAVPHPAPTKNEWTEVSKCSKTAKDKGKATLPSTPVTPNPFQAIGDIEPSGTDTTPKHNPLVTKLILVDEKEGRELKNKGRNNVETGQAPKKRDKRGGYQVPKLIFMVSYD